MLCEECQQDDATIHLTQVVEGEVKKLHLCEACAVKNGVDPHSPVSVTDVLLGFGKEVNVPSRTQTASCPRCFMSRADFKKTGRLGCPACYDAFKEDLHSLIKAMHHSDQHCGKIPARESKRVKVTMEMAQLRKELERAIHEERYEQAAELRDALQACEQQLDTEESKAET